MYLHGKNQLILKTQNWLLPGLQAGTEVTEDLTIKIKVFFWDQLIESQVNTPFSELAETLTKKKIN